LTAEKYDALPLARGLYQLAYELDPEHSNNMQNYADFIIVKRQTDLYSLAEQLITRLKQGKHADHRPERTIALEAQLHRLQGTTASSLSNEEREKLQGFIDNFRKDPTDRGDFARLVNLFSQLADYDSLREVCRVYYMACTNDEDRHLALRLLADGLWDSKVEYDRQEAMDLYRYLLTSRLAQTKAAQDEMEDTEHNYAVLLYAYDYDDEAGRIWFDAYQRDPTDGHIKRAYSQYLLRAGSPELAEKVTKGEPVTEMVLQPHNKDMPEWFLDQASRWWELPDDDPAAPAAPRPVAPEARPAAGQSADLAAALQDSSFDWARFGTALNGNMSSSNPPSTASDTLGTPADAAPGADLAAPAPPSDDAEPLVDTDSSPPPASAGDADDAAQ
jgi:hypothetical protein